MEVSAIAQELLDKMKDGSAQILDQTRDEEPEIHTNLARKLAQVVDILSEVRRSLCELDESQPTLARQGFRSGSSFYPDHESMNSHETQDAEAQADGSYET